MGLEPASVRPSVRPCVRASVRASVRPHFQSWISPRPAGRLQSNFIWSIIGVGERLHYLLVQIRSELWFPWQQIAPIGLQWGKGRHHVFSAVFDRILFILAGNYNMHKSLHEFEIRPDLTTDNGVSCPWASEKNSHRLIMGKTTSSHFLSCFWSDPFHICR